MTTSLLSFLIGALAGAAIIAAFTGEHWIWRATQWLQPRLNTAYRVFNPNAAAKVIGGWHARTNVNYRQLWRVTIHTSIDDWDEWVLARSEDEVKRWIAKTHPDGFCRGYEPTIERMDSGLDSIYWIR